MFILDLLKNPRTIVTFVFALLALAVIRYGASIGLRGSLQWIVVGVLGLLFIGVQLLIGRIGRKKGKQTDEDIEKSIVVEADQSIVNAPDDEKQVRAKAKQELVEVIAALKKSGGHGGAALSALPWYVVLGTGASGKSTLIRNSGLQLPGADTLSGISSSASCEWWFTNQAVLLEASRRFLDDGGTGDRDWRAFLEQIRKHRPDTSLNGLIVCIGADELQQWDEDRLASLATTLRRRLDAAGEVLQLHIPIYVVVTKADTIVGFDDFFADLDTAPRNQIFGATFAAARMRSDDPAGNFRREFDLLGAEIHRRRIPRLAAERDPARLGGAFGFPLQLGGLRDKMANWLGALCRPNPYGANPSLRGFYFTSGAGRDVGRKPHFLKGFFLKALIPDFQLAQPTSARRSRQRLQKLILRGAGFAALGLIGLLLVVSFSRNLSLLSSTREMAESARTVVVKSNDVRGLKESLEQLDRLRERLIQLDRSDSFRSPALGMGLYRGNRINARAREIYIDRLVTILLATSRGKLETQLLRETPSTPAENEAFVARYRAYRMLVDPDHGEPVFLSGQLQDLWSRGGTDREASQRVLDLIDQNVHYGWDHAEDVRARSAVLPGLDGKLTSRAARFIRDSWKPDRYYETMIADINSRVRGYRLADLANSENLLVAAAGLDSVAGAYTIEGWRSEVRQAIESSDQRLREDWILRDVFKDQDMSIMGWLVRRYAESYAEAWAGLLGAVDMAPANGVQRAGRQVWDLAGLDSPFVLLLEDARGNLRFEGGDLGDDEETMAPLAAVASDFAALHSLFDEGDDGRPVDAVVAGLEAIAGELDALQDADDLAAASAEFTLGVFKAPSKDPSGIHALMITARRHVSRAPATAAAEANAAVRAYLESPAKGAWRACLAETGRHLDRRWREVVVGAFNESMRGRYPIDPNGSDASLGDFTGFFGPAGTLKTFVDAELAPYTKTGWQSEIIYGHGLYLSRAARDALTKADTIRRGLFSGNAVTPRVNFSIEPAQVPSPEGTNYIISRSLLQLGRQRLNYDMGRAQWRDFTWPDEDESITGRVGVAMQTHQAEPIDIAASNWTIFRLLQRADIKVVDNRNYELTWTLKRPGEYELPVPFRLRASTSTNPFARGFFNFRCPNSLTGG